MEIDLLDLYPKTNRDLKSRVNNKTEEQVRLAKKYDWEYFDKKGICYGGYTYDGRWLPVVKRFIDYYNLKPHDRILDVGCAKGYMLYDFLQVEPDLEVIGIDISQYAIGCSPTENDWRRKRFTIL
jgi:cyclopropane fatty-acyl-phospholipid synthase-like methyltransferase